MYKYGLAWGIITTSGQKEIKSCIGHHKLTSGAVVGLTPVFSPNYLLYLCEVFFATVRTRNLRCFLFFLTLWDSATVPHIYGIVQS